MKYSVLFLFTLLITGFTFAQAPMKTTTSYNGQKYPCFIIEYNLPPDETENVIKEKLKAEGYNADKSKGYFVYRNARFKDLNSNESQDVFFKVERKSRKEKDQSIVTMIAVKAGSIPEDKVKGASPTTDIEPSANSVSFMNSFQDAVSTQAHNLAVASQEDLVANAEKRLKSLQDSQSKLEKKIKDYQSDLEGNKKDQQVQTEEIAKQKTLLDLLKNPPAEK